MSELVEDTTVFNVNISKLLVIGWSRVINLSNDRQTRTRGKHMNSLFKTYINKQYLYKYFLHKAVDQNKWFIPSLEKEYPRSMHWVEYF